ncbi:MAG: pre-peptidase C-terminal domain-containing protein [Phycisphaerales bacterium]|nr:MAG: pre-peptidase C-terminal domain-containing protein [Phycisphaerales bacterium]
MNGPSRSHLRNILVLLAVVASLTSVASGAPGSLTNGVPVTGLSGTIGSEKFYAIVVPAGQDELEISISGSTGDCDLYVRRNSAPTTTSYDYRPYELGSNETVTVESPAGGTWYIMLRGYTAYSGLTLVATYSASTSVIPLTNDVPVTGLSGAMGTEVFFSVDIPSGQSKLQIAISGGTGDCDLYVKRGAVPTTSDYDYRPFLPGNEETVSVDNPAGGTWYIMLRGYSAYAGVTLLASYGGGVGTLLENGVPVPGLAGTLGSEKIYRINVPAGQTNLEISISGGTGDADLYVKYGARPTTSDWDYRPFLAGNEETVSVASPTGGTWYIVVRGYAAYSGVTLVASYGEAITIEDNVPVPNLSGPLNSMRYYKIEVPSGQTDLKIMIYGGTGNCDLYVKYGSKPTLSSWDYRPYLPANDETVTIDNPEGGTWYIMLHARQAYSDVTLLADYWFTGTVTLLTNGVPVPNIAGAEGSEKFYRIIVPSDRTKLEIKIFGGTGDADLYVKLGSPPTTTDWDYRPYEIGNDETVTIDDPPSGNWLIMIRGYHAYAGVTLVATHEDKGGGPGDVIPLTNGVPVTGLAGATDSQVFYKIDVPAGQANLEIVMSGGTGDADLYVRKDAQPTLTEWDYRPYLIGNNETVSIDSPAAGTYFIMINAYVAYADATLVATYVPVPDTVTPLTNGVPVKGLGAPTGDEDFYKIVVPAGQDFLNISISGGTGDCDLYVKKGSKPTTSSWDYRPYLIGNDETVEIANPAAATWYIMLRAYQTYASVNLVATYGTAAVGNDFTTDSHCKALWRFEPDELTTDSIGSNTLTSQFAPTAETGDYQEGEGSCDLTGGTFLITDQDLDAGFPLKSGDTNKNISVAFWMKAPYGQTNATGGVIFGKGGSAGLYSFNIAFREPSGAGTGSIDVHIGIYGGTNHDTMRIPKVIHRDQWYHVAVTYEDHETYGNTRIRIYDPSDDSVTEAVDMTIEGIHISKGAVKIGTYRYASQTYVGLVDELVVFDDVLTANEIDLIRQGSYGKP